MDLQCSTPHCDKKAVFRCPTCIEEGNASNSFYCSQACFKAFWPVHRLVHGQKAQGAISAKFAKFHFSGPLRPGAVSPMKKPPPGVEWPDYAISSVPKAEEAWDERTIPVVEGEEEIAKVRAVGLLARRALDVGHALVRPGTTTSEINAAVHDFIVKEGAYPSPLNYRGFPKAICTSVNEVICHGIPDSRLLQEGDIVNLDVSVFAHGYHSDINETYAVGEIDAESRRLITTTRRALDAAIAICRPGVLYRRIGDAIAEVVGPEGFSIVRSYCGHGVGRLFHAPPNVSHYPNNKDSGIMRPGHVFTIEPMINAGSCADMLWPDRWTSTTRDGRRSAQFEDTLLVTADGVEVLTKRLPDSPPLCL